MAAGLADAERPGAAAATAALERDFTWSGTCRYPPFWLLLLEALIALTTFKGSITNANNNDDNNDNSDDN